MGQNRQQVEQPPAIDSVKVTARDIPSLFGEAIRHFNAGRYPEAESLCRTILDINHYHADGLHLLGILTRYAGNREESLALIQKAIRIKGDVSCYHNSLGNVLQELGRFDEAATSLRRALALGPNQAEPYNNLGNVLKEQGRLEEALVSYERAIALKPDYAEAHYNTGLALNKQGRFHDALTSFQRALAIRPTYADAHLNRGVSFKLLGDYASALTCLRKAAALEPQNDIIWAQMSWLLETIRFNAADEGLLREFFDMLARPVVAPSTVCRPLLSVLEHEPVYKGLLARVNNPGPDQTIVYAEAAEQLSGLPLFLRLISLTAAVQGRAEKLLTSLRRALLHDVDAGIPVTKGLPFTAALALQCFINEYVFQETPEEEAALGRLENKIAVLATRPADLSPAWVAALAAYRPLFRFPWAAGLLKGTWPEEVSAVLVQQVVEPLEEQNLRLTIPCHAAIRDETSKVVQAQYEENPYPRWVRPRRDPVALSVQKVMKAVFPHTDFTGVSFPACPEILIAGTGTGEQALTVASRFANARLLAVDLSLSSLSYAVRKTREMAVTGIEFAQADILELAVIGRQFDIIDSSGVLHHMKDPMAGWRVLTERLRPGGLMKIGLYSELAREPVVKARALISEKGYQPTPQDIRRCRQDIQAESADPVLQEIAGFRDFYSLSECRDLMFHVQEHRFTLPQIEAALRELRLDFIGFELNDAAAMNRFREINPDPAALASLPVWDAFEHQNPRTFRGMYQFWCWKNPRKEG